MASLSLSNLNVYPFQSKSPLSNYYPTQLVFDGLAFSSSEAAYQSHKTNNPNLWVKFVGLNPDDAKKLGRSVQLRPDWEEIKFTLMYNVVNAKFAQCAEFRKELMSTGNKLIVEETTPWHDPIWGVCNCQKCKTEHITSQNLLGIALTMLRENKRIVYLNGSC